MRIICFNCCQIFTARRGPALRCPDCAALFRETVSHVRVVVKAAIQGGALVRRPCEACSDIKADAHHDDYRYPLRVRWLCRTHHRRFHVAEAHAHFVASRSASIQNGAIS